MNFAHSSTAPRRPRSFSARKGSALITVVMLTAMMALLTASMLTYSMSERRGNERNRLILRAKNMSENIALYGAEQLIPKLNRMGSAPVGVFPWTGTSANRIYLPPDSILNTAFSSSSVGMEMRAGIESNTPYALVTDVTSPNNGLQVSTAKVPIITKATASHSSLGSVSAYAEQDMQLSLTPLFQFGIFYNMDLELFPGQDMVIMGPVHTNGRLTARGEQGGTAVIDFTDRVTSAMGLYADGQMKATYVKRAGSTAAGAGGTGAVNYKPVSGSAVNLKSSGGVWRDHKYGSATESTSTVNQFKTFATSTYGGNVRSSAHGVSKLELPGIGSYNETNLSTTPEDDRSNGRQMIEPRNPQKWLFNSTSSAWEWMDTTDDAATKELKMSRKCGLYIMVNPDDTARLGRLPDGTTEPILPRSYRAWLNIINSDSTHTLREVVLPGQPTYGYNDGGTPGTTAALMADDTMYDNVLPNRYTTGTAVGSNQVLRTVQQGYNLATGYLINNAAGYAIGATDLAVDTGTGIIQAGEVLTIGAYRYLVVGNLSGGIVKIGAPGLAAAVTDNTAVTVGPSTLGTGTSFAIDTATNYTTGATALNLDGDTKTIIPGNMVLINGQRYLVTRAPVAAPANTSTDYPIGIASPGIRTASADNNMSVLIQTDTGAMGTGKNYFTNNAIDYPVGTQTISLDTGVGTIHAGNFLYIGGQRYMAASSLNGGVITIVPGLVSIATDNTRVTLDPLPYTGYTVIGGSGGSFPAEAATQPYPAEAFFFDLRRADGNVGYNSNIAGGSARSTTNYKPRAIVKIDFDLARFKMMVNRVMSTLSTLTSDGLSSTGYNVDYPTSTNWTNSIYNSGGTATSIALGTDADLVTAFTYTVLPATGSDEAVNRMDPFQLYYTPAYLDSSAPSLVPADPRTLAVPAADLSSAWYDGVAIYLQSVEAERRAQTITAGINDRVDSGVRLINGRGPLVSLSTTAKTGFTFATNDAAYLIGHFNADGTVNSTTTSTTAIGGYSARFPDSSNEKLASVMADAITLLSQPVFSTASTPYYQTNGWNDALSAFRITDASWVATWDTAAPSSSNQFEGLGTSATAIRPGALPTSSTPGSTGSTWRTKLPTVNTEFSAALLMGLIPSNHNATNLSDRPPISAANAQYSGGAHNFPRLIEDWHNDMGSGTNSGLYIRGSMVALFESRVAMEPWNIRCYAAPDRYWGLHEGFRTANHDVPLEPLVIGADRLGFRELSATEYATRKTYLEGLTVIP